MELILSKKASRFASHSVCLIIGKSNAGINMLHNNSFKRFLSLISIPILYALELQIYIKFYNCTRAKRIIYTPNLRTFFSASYQSKTPALAQVCYLCQLKGTGHRPAPARGFIKIPKVNNNPDLCYFLHKPMQT
jgi:hypothetical protein